MQNPSNVPLVKLRYRQLFRLIDRCFISVTFPYLAKKFFFNYQEKTCRFGDEHQSTAVRNATFFMNITLSKHQAA